MNKKELRQSTTLDVIKPEILIAEDNEFQLIVLMNLMKRMTIKFQVASNGIIAFNSFKEKIAKENRRFTLILMDLVMPFKNGFEATQDIRNYEISEKFEQTFICGMSSDYSREIENKCKISGMNHFMKKPIQMDELKNLIDSINKNELETLLFKTTN